MFDTFADDSQRPSGNRLVRRLFLLAVIPAVILASRMAQSDELTVAFDYSDTPTIEGRTSGPVFFQQTTPPQPADDAVDESQPFEPKPSVEPAPNSDSPFAPVAPQEMADDAEKPGNDWGIDIAPNSKPVSNGLTYRQVYDSIPFSRAEYLANPSYRHEATMELLTGTPRQTVIHRTYEPQLNGPTPTQPEFLYNNYPNTYGGYGPSYGFGYSGSIYPPTFRYFLPLDFGY